MIGCIGSVVTNNYKLIELLFLHKMLLFFLFADYRFCLILNSVIITVLPPCWNYWFLLSAALIKQCYMKVVTCILETTLSWRHKHVRPNKCLLEVIWTTVDFDQDHHSNKKLSSVLLEVFFFLYLFFKNYCNYQYSQ